VYIRFLGRFKSCYSIRCYTRPSDDWCICGDHYTGNYQRWRTC